MGDVKMCEVCGELPARFLSKLGPDKQPLVGKYCSNTCGRKAFRLRNPNYSREASRDFRKRNPDYMTQSGREFRKKNPGYFSKASRDYRARQASLKLEVRG